MRKGELEKDTDKMMREYRAQLDAERARKLAHGRNHSSSKSDRKRGMSQCLIKVEKIYLFFVFSCPSLVPFFYMLLILSL